MTDSPFLPNTNIQYAWDSTSLEKIKRCPRLYQYEMIEGWVSKDESIHLRFGVEYHAALQGYALERSAAINHDDAVHDVVREALVRTADWDPDPDTKAGTIKNRNSLVRTVVWYLDHFKDDKASTVILSNGQPAVEQSFRFELDYEPEAGPDDIPYVLCGHLDRIVTFNGELYVMDHKTSSRSIGPWYFDQWEPHNQMTLYSLASKVVLDAPVRGVIIDAAYLHQKDGEVVADFGRGFTYRTPDQLDEWLVDLRSWLDLAERYATAGHWPQNDTACDKYGGCRFREICSKSPAVRDRFLEGNFVKQAPEDRWNPLKAR